MLFGFTLNFLALCLLKGCILFLISVLLGVCYKKVLPFACLCLLTVTATFFHFRPSSPQGPHQDLPPTMSASDLQEKGVRIPRSPKISRPPSIERDLVYASVAPMPAPKCAVGAACLNGKLVVCGKLICHRYTTQFLNGVVEKYNGEGGGESK